MPFWHCDDHLAAYTGHIDYDTIDTIRSERSAFVDREFWQPLHRQIDALPVAESFSNLSINTDCDAVQIGIHDDLNAEQHDQLVDILTFLKPWRKGPYSVFGVDLDAEWRSYLKWDRVSPHLTDLKGKRVLDIGCSNGYYMFRAASQQPEFILGIDPSEKFYHCFHLFQNYIRNPSLQYELLGMEHVKHFPKFFDVILCMGIVYHRPDPIEMLNDIHTALAPGGQLIFESMAIPGNDPVALYPHDRYAKMRNVFFVPTASCMEAWLTRCGFVDINIVSQDITTVAEQRATDWMNFESLSDYLDPDDHTKTLEGYPAPRRVTVTARKTEA
jgi:tRNA (mo5U34)-methyltransferase